MLVELCVALVLSVLINVVLFIKSKWNSVNTSAYNKDYENLKKEKNDLLEERGKLKGILEEKDININRLQEENKNLKSGLEEVKQRNNTLIANNKVLENQNTNLLEELQSKANYNDIQQENIILKQKLEQEQKQKDEYYKKINENIEANFKNISNEVIRQQKQEFTEQQKITLQPFETQLKDFKNTMEQINKTNIENKTSLEKHIELLNTNSQNLQKEAQDLTNALKGDKKAQGNWGEIQLERLLEITNLQEGIDYTKQETHVSEDGVTHRPDFIIHLPDDRKVIIDSKVSLNNYIEYTKAMEQKDKELYLKKYMDDLKNHIKELGDKEYQKDLKAKYPDLKSLDYVFMFVPLERAYIDAIDCSKNSNNNIFEFANRNKVAIATPSSLMPILKIIEHIWSIEKQNKNTAKIAELGGKIYDKLVGFQDDMNKIDETLDKAHKYYNEAYKKLYDGKGNVYKMAEELKNYGVNTKKQLMVDGGEDGGLLVEE